MAVRGVAYIGSILPSSLVQRRLKVALLNLCFPDYTVALANALSQQVDLTWIQIGSQGLAWQSKIDPKIHTLFRDLRRKRDPRSLQSFSELLQCVADLQPDILHIQDSVNPWFDFIASVRDLPPTVVTVHDAVQHPGENGGEWLTGRLRNRLLRRSRAVIVHAESQRKLIGSSGAIPLDQIHVIPHGELGSLYRAAAEPVPEPPRSRPEVVLFFGRIADYKGLGVLVAAMELVVEKVPAARLVVAGSGVPITRYIRADRACPWVIVIDEFIPHRQVASLFGCVGMVVLPYLEASQSGVASLAMGMGVPVIASAVGGLRDLIRDGVDGVLVPPDDPVSLANAIINMMRNELQRDRLSQAGMARSRDDLAWSAIAGETVSLYGKVLCS